MPNKKLYPNEETVAMSIRVPESLKKVIEERAVTNRRSQNQEVVWLIEVALDHLREAPSEEA
jgi:hypothetical protein